MTEQLPTKQVSLDDLKRAIENSEWASRHAMSVTVLQAKSEAWRTAFEWREGWNGRFMDKALSHSLTNADMPLIDEGAEGMRLIREKLR